MVPDAASDIDKSLLESCPQYNGREEVVQLELTTTIESSLAGTVVVSGFVPSIADEYHLVDLAFEFSNEPSCELVTVESQTTINMENLQPHAPDHFEMWVILLNAITPADQHPSLKALEHGQWNIGEPQAAVNNAPVRWSEPLGAISVVRR